MRNLSGCGEAWQIEVVWASVDDWVSAYRKVKVAGARCKGRNRKTWKECVDDDMKVLGLHPEWEIFRDEWRDFIWANV